MEEIKELYRLKMIHAILKESADYMSTVLDEIDEINEYDSMEDALTEENIQNTLDFINVNLNIIKQYMPSKDGYKQLIQALSERNER